MTTIAPSIGYQETALTREGYERLRDELDALTTTGRADIRDRVRDARAQGGQLTDNPDLIETLEDQEILERRIATLESALASARVVDDPPNDGTIGIGTHVRFRNTETGHTAEFELVGSMEASPSRRTLSAESPVGQALLGRRAGDVVEAQVPRGSMRIAILDVRRPALASPG